MKWWSRRDGAEALEFLFGTGNMPGGIRMSYRK